MEDLNKLIMEAMKNHNDNEVKVFRLIKAEFLKIEKSGSFSGWTDELKMQILNKMAQQRKDSIAQYQSANRQDLADYEQIELDIINSFLPKAPTEAELNSEIDRIVDELKATGTPVDMKQMKHIMASVKSKYPVVDGKLLSSLIKNKIS